MRWFEYLMLFVAILNMVFIGVTGYNLLRVTAQPISLSINGQAIGQQAYGGDISDLQILSQRFARAHQYNETGYNCVNYSDDFVRIGRDLGFNVWTRSGCAYANNTYCHKWVVTELELEPQSGMFKEFEKEFPFLRE